MSRLRIWTPLILFSKSQHSGYGLRAPKLWDSYVALKKSVAIPIVSKEAKTMSEENRKSALVPMYLDPEAQGKERKTFICIGVPRGGTSAVAGLMQRLGIFMGEDLPNNYEDPEFIHKPPAHMKSVIEKRNQDHALWGWKFPAAANYLENILPHVENPHLVVVFRDLVATMKAHMRWHNRNQLFAAHEIILQQQKNWFLVERWKVPTAMVSYEKAILAPNLFTHDMATFLGQPLPGEEQQQEITEFLTPGRYK